METSVLEFKGCEIAFKKSLINVGPVSAMFGKKPKEWLNNLETRTLIDIISDRNHLKKSEVVKVVYGGSYAGTWMCEELLLPYAQWLSAEFYLWYYKLLIGKLQFVANEEDLRFKSLAHANREQEIALIQKRNAENEVKVVQIKINVIRIAQSLNLREGVVWDILFNHVMLNFGFNVASHKKDWESRMECLIRKSYLNLAVDATNMSNRSAFV